MSAPSSDELSKFIGSPVFDDFGRTLGTLIAVESNVDGKVVSITIKSEDLTLQTIEGERVKLNDGKVVITPEWKFELINVIDNLDRAYKRRKALDNIISNSDIPAIVTEPMKRSLEEEIKSLKLKADDVRKLVNSRLAEIDDENLKVARAIATVSISYFSGEINDKSYTQSMNHLRKLQSSLSEEKKAAKELLEKLDKVMQLAVESESKTSVVPQPQQAQAPASASQPQQAMVVKIEA